jgi:hypothetical protein
MPEGTMEKIKELVEVSWQCGQFADSGYVDNTGIKKNRETPQRKSLYIQARSINSFNELYS